MYYSRPFFILSHIDYFSDRLLANNRNFTILGSPALFGNHPENSVLTRFSATLRLARKLCMDLEQSAERRR